MAHLRRLSSSVAILSFLFMLIAAASSSDMSIIAYDRAHPDKSDSRIDVVVATMYEDWLARHRYVHNRLGEKEKRFKIFKDNLRFIDMHNSENMTYRLGLNRFADLTNEEHHARYLRGRMNQRRRLVLVP